MIPRRSTVHEQGKVIFEVSVQFDESIPGEAQHSHERIVDQVPWLCETLPSAAN